MGAQKNYLSRLPDADQRVHPRRQTNKPGTVYYLRHGVRGYSSQKCRMSNISEGGCYLIRVVTDQVPDFVYLVLDDLPAKFPCAVVDRSEDGLHLKFMTDLPTAVVDTIAQKKFARK